MNDVGPFERPIRVLHSVGMLNPGGVERLRLSIFRNLRPPDFEHRLICTKIVDDWMARAVTDLGVEIVETGPVPNVLHPARYLLGARVAARWRPHIFHGAIIEGYTLAVVSGVLGRVPVRILEETSDPLSGGRSARANMLVKGMANFASICIGVSNSVSSYLSQIGVPDSKIRTIYNGVPPPRRAAPSESIKIRTELGWRRDDVVVGTVSRLDEAVKRISILIEAVAAVARTGQQVRLLIIGEGPDRQMLQEHVRRFDLEGSVAFAGLQTDLSPWYGAMDVFALASTTEAFGLAIVEAMFHQLPVVATGVGGIPEIVVHGSTGRLVPPDDPLGMAREIGLLARDPSERRSMGLRGEERAQARFSERRYISDISSLYRGLVPRASSGVT